MYPGYVATMVHNSNDMLFIYEIVFISSSKNDLHIKEKSFTG